MSEDNDKTALVPYVAPGTTGGKGLRKSNRKYEALALFITERVAFLYHSQSNLMRVSGFRTRQAINERFVAACNRATNHDWWETILMVPPGSLKDIGASEEAATEAINKYNNPSLYGGKAECHMIRAIGEAMALSVTSWDVAFRAEKMNRVNSERTAKLLQARKDREKILGF